MMRAPALVLITTVLLTRNNAPSAAAAASSASTSIPEVSMGTTILAVRYRDGIVVGADTRTSVGAYVSNRFASKLTFVLDVDVDSYVVPYRFEEGEKDNSVEQRTDAAKTTERSSLSTEPAAVGSTCCLCRAGSSADTQHLADKVRYELVSRQIVYGRRGTVTNAARLVRNLMWDEPDLSASLICGGYDHVLGRGVIYSVSRGGTWMEEPDFAVAGSGSTFVLGYMDANYPRGDEAGGAVSWDEASAVEFVGKAIELAMDRDGSSGGFIRLYVIDRFGRRSSLKVPHSNLGSVDDGRGGILNRAPTKATGIAKLKGFAPASKVK